MVVAAISINPIDWKLMSGALKFIMPVKFPSVPCFDLAGTVVEAAEGGDFKTGDKVFVRLSTLLGGAAAKEVVLDASAAALIPEGMTFAEAAGLPLAGLTALQGLRDHGGLKTDGKAQSVLVVGASGGVGHLAVQIAVASGAKVTATCGSKNVALVKSLGANTVVDYQTQYLTQVLRDQEFDLVLDCVGQKGSLKTLTALTHKSGTLCHPRARPCGDFAKATVLVQT